LLAEVSAKLTVIRTIQECVAFLSRSLVTEFDRGYLRGWEAGCDHAWQSAGIADPFPWRNSSDPGQETEEVAGALASEGQNADGNELEAMAEALATEVGTLWEAFSRFCRAEIGADPEMLLRAWLPPTGSWTEDALNAVDGVRVDADVLLEYETALTKAWREFLQA
jgi:hypothetical protein